MNKQYFGKANQNLNFTFSTLFRYYLSNKSSKIFRRFLKMPFVSSLLSFGSVLIKKYMKNYLFVLDKIFQQKPKTKQKKKRNIY